MSGQAFYKAKVACRVGGAYRKAGEIFPLPKFEVTPPFLEEVSPPSDAPETETSQSPDGPASPARRRGGPKATPPGPMPSDLPGVVRD